MEIRETTQLGVGRQKDRRQRRLHAWRSCLGSASTHTFKAEIHGQCTRACKKCMMGRVGEKGWGGGVAVLRAVSHDWVHVENLLNATLNLQTCQISAWCRPLTPSRGWRPAKPRQECGIFDNKSKIHCSQPTISGVTLLEIPLILTAAAVGRQKEPNCRTESFDGWQYHIRPSWAHWQTFYPPPPPCCGHARSARSFHSTAHLIPSIPPLPAFYLLQWHSLKKK